MKLINSDKNRSILEISLLEYEQLVNMAQAVEQYFDEIDPYILEMSRQEVQQIRKSLVENIPSI